MLESYSTTALTSAIQLAEWSPTMDLIAITYANSPEIIELRRMDWTKVNSISLNSSATAMCFNPNGRMICAATADNKLLLFGIEETRILSSMSFDTEITTVAMDECNGIQITAVGFADATVSLFSDFHFALCQIHLYLPAVKISLCDEDIYFLHEDHLTVSCFSLPFLKTDASLIQATSSAFSSYWMHFHTIENATAIISSKWKQIWEDSSLFVPHNEKIARCFLLGQNPPELSSEVHLTRLQKSICNEFADIQKLFSQDIVPSFIALDKATRQIEAAAEMSGKLKVQLKSISSNAQIHNSLTMMENFRKLSNCFDAFFAYLIGSLSAQPNTGNISQSTYEILDNYKISATEFGDFLVNYFHKFDLLNIQIGQPPESEPVFEAVHKNELELPSRFSSVNKEKCACIGSELSVYDLKSQENTKYAIDGHPLAAYAFSTGTVGCFYNSNTDDDNVMFVMLNGDNDSPASVSLENSTLFFISPRRIALVESTEMFASVIDLEIPEPDEEVEEEDNE